MNHGLVIIDNGNKNNKSSNEKSTQAYRLFEEGKKPVEVAIQLGLSEKEATRYYAEFWKLKRLYKLYQIYTELEHCLPSFLKLHSALKKKGLNPSNVEWFANAVETGAVKLPELHSQYENSKKLLQKEYQNLQNKVHTLHYQEQKLERDLQVIQRQIVDLTETEALYGSNCDTLQKEIEYLYNEKCRLEQFVSRFRNTNKKYLKIKSIAEEEVNRLLSEEEPLLDLAFNAVIEALRMAPDRYAIIFNTKYDDNNNVFNSNNSNMVGVSYSFSSHKDYQNYYYNEYHEGILEIAKGVLNILTNHLVNKTMVVAMEGK